MAHREVDMEQVPGAAQGQKPSQLKASSGPPAVPHGVAEAKSLFDRQILRHALVDSFKKLDPRVQVRTRSCSSSWSARR